MYKRNSIKLIALMVCTSFLAGCASVKGYDREYLNDEEMKLSLRYCQKHEAYYQIIREGASGASGGKTGGGCGCN